MDYLKNIRTRIPFPVMQEHCILEKLPTAVGWDRLQDKLDDESRQSKKRAIEISEALSRIYRKTITLGERAVRLYRVDESVIAQMHKYLGNLQTEQSPFIRKYPLPISESGLKNAGSGLHLCDILKDPKSVSLIFCGRRLIEERDDRRRDQISKEAIERFGWGEYDEFVFIKRRYVQTFEVATLDLAQGLLNLRVEQHTGTDTTSSLEQLQDKTNELLASKFKSDQQLVRPINLFPAIRSIYNAAREGVVVELGFTTETGSAKHEKMRNKQDLRRELFHTGGKKAVGGVITPYRIAVRWAEDSQRVPEEVLLPGSIRQLGGSRYLDHAVLSGALSEERMQALTQRIIKYLPADED